MLSQMAHGGSDLKPWQEMTGARVVLYVSTRFSQSVENKRDGTSESNTRSQILSRELTGTVNFQSAECDDHSHTLVGLNQTICVCIYGLRQPLDAEPSDMQQRRKHTYYKQ